MALHVTYKTDSGLEVENAYVSIIGFSADKVKTTVAVSVYKDKDACEGHGVAIANRQYYAENTDIIAKEGMTLVQAVYGWLKTHPEFAGAIDV